jgi:hypothetical protein
MRASIRGRDELTVRVQTALSLTPKCLVKNRHTGLAFGRKRTRPMLGCHTRRAWCKLSYRISKSVSMLGSYPMNALINSQLKALQDYEKTAGGSLVRFERYTGQEKQDKRDQILNDPPHILLTNYVMLEYMLLRPAERILTSKATAHLEFLVLDELHTYRGRQGADVAMLLRRLRERTGNPKLIHIGTSATMATEGSRTCRLRLCFA